MYERYETFRISHHVSTRHSKSKKGGSCTLTSHLRLTVGESGVLENATSGFLASVSLHLLPEDKTVLLESQPFAYSDQVTFTRPCQDCAVCNPPATASSSSSSSSGQGDPASASPEAPVLRAQVTVHFETIPALKAGSFSLPPSVPPPWTGPYSFPIDSRGSGFQDISVLLFRVDYQEVYAPPSVPRQHVASSSITANSGP